MLKYLEENSDITVKKIYFKVKKRRIKVSLSTVKRRLVEAEVEFKSILLKSLLLKDYKRKYLE